MPKRNALVALALLMPLPSLGVWLGMVVFKDTALGMTCYFTAKGAVLLLPLLWHLLVDKERPGLSPVRQGGLGMGALLGLATAAVIGLAWWLIGRHLIDPATLRGFAAEQGFTPARYLALAAFLCLVNAPLEEYVWRWFVVRQGERLLPRWGAIWLSAVGFTVHHVIIMKVNLGHWGAVAIAAVGIAIGGALWSWLYVRYRSVWPAFLAHLGADIAILVIGYMVIFG